MRDIEPALHREGRLPRRRGAIAVAAAALLVFAAPSTAAASVEGGPLGARLHPAALAPFALLLAAIAVLPLAASHWWESNANKAIVAAALAVPTAAYLLSFGDGGRHALEESVLDYLAFIALLGSLFVITGGVFIQGSLSGTPLVNTAILGFGAVLANVVGTTGASVLLIRPLLRANAPRRRTVHVVIFFILVVSNSGGLLTPLGDPPLFMGFLKGVPFEWTLRLWPQWLLVNGLLLALFNVWDQIVLNREERERPGSQLEEVQRHEPLRVRGWHNVALLAGIVLVVYAAGRGWGNAGREWHKLAQAAAMVAIGAAAYVLTPGRIRAANRFTMGPIVEVAVLFAGIFITMIPALSILNARGAELGLSHPAHFFWASGSLSSVLDNAPTYITFAATAAGLEQFADEQGVRIDPTGRYLAEFLARSSRGDRAAGLPPGTEAASLLAAISCGAVFMGANTYIGNGPNFMVKAIAEENGIQMPSFAGYMLYSCGILVPIFVLATVLFFI